MKKIAAITMLRHDEDFLRKWVSYYGEELGRNNLYVFLDGTDQRIPDFCDGIHIKAVERIVGNVREGDKGRIAYLSKVAKGLFEQGYDMVIGTDVDEFLIPDPSCQKGLAAFLSQAWEHSQKHACLSGLGIDIGQKLGIEESIDFARPLLDQRSYAKLSTRYTKASVLIKPTQGKTFPQWGSGFHRVRGHNFHIIKDLYLFHFGSLDLDRIRQRMEKTDLVAKGWGRHFAKRTKTITLVSERKPCPWEKAVGFARCCQTWIRPPYAWNKPAMFELKIVVQIPERFQGKV
ncbi:MAG: glycosyltransferase family 2 protein [Bacteroidales bacterium]|nr:glycosyltransferase family 2 protein [Bacteroidales bacterium]